MDKYEDVVSALMMDGIVHDEWEGCGDKVARALRSAHKAGREEAFAEVRSGKVLTVARRK